MSKHEFHSQANQGTPGSRAASPSEDRDQAESTPLQALRTEFEAFAQAKNSEIVAVIGAQRVLQKLVLGILVAAIIMSLGTSLFLIKQMRLVRQQLELQRSASGESLRDFTVRIEPEIHRFAAELQTFSGTNTDFRPILEYFQPRMSRYFSTSLPVPPASQRLSEDSSIESP